MLAIIQPLELAAVGDRCKHRRACDETRTHGTRKAAVERASSMLYGSAARERTKAECTHQTARPVKRRYGHAAARPIGDS